MIHFTYQPDTNPVSAAQGWGCGLLTIGNRPFWYGGEPNGPQPLHWTWIDLLEHLGRYWSELTTEAPWPNARLASAMQQGQDFWTHAEDGWSEMAQSRAQTQEQALLDFVRPRNLALAWKGLSLPAVYCYRQGLDVLICPEGQTPLQTTFSAFSQCLEDLANAIAQGLGNTRHPRAMAAKQTWRNRHNMPILQRIGITTGIDEATLMQLQGGQVAHKFWGLHASANDEDFNTNALLAAARMTRPMQLDASGQQQILDLLRNLPVVPNARDRLNQLAVKIGTSWYQSRWKPHTQGYALARRYLQVCNIAADGTFPIERILVELGVVILHVELGCAALQAIAVWGSNGPAIVLNADAESATCHSHVQRIVLAHELCHLLIDRQHALPAADVLGGHVVTLVEQRAKAFAAELLLTRADAAKAYLAQTDEKTALRDATTCLVQQYEVSPIVAKTQMLNSGNMRYRDKLEIKNLLSESIELA